MTEEWTNRVVGERMAVDQEFSERVVNSEFSNQEWSLIMSAVQFTIEDADDPDAARIVVDREETNLAAIMPELENIQEQMGALGGGAPGGGGGGGGGGGLFDGVKSALGLGGGGAGDEDYEDRANAARQLADEYGRELQTHLESKGRWEEICTVAVAEGSDETLDGNGGAVDADAVDDADGHDASDEGAVDDATDEDA